MKQTTSSNSSATRLIKLSALGISSIFSLTIVSTPAIADFPLEPILEHIRYQQIQSKSAPSATEVKMGADVLGIYNGGFLSKSATSEKIPLIITANSGASYQLSNQLQTLGLRVDIQDGNNLYVYAYPSQLEDISSLSAVKTLNKQPITSIDDRSAAELLGLILDDDQGSDESEVYTPAPTPSATPRPVTARASRKTTPNQNDVGFQKMYANNFHDRGIYGQGLKIGVIDFGYNGYDTVKSKGLLPTPKATRKFFAGAEYSQLDKHDVTQHGSAVAEIIYNLAPQASYYLAQVGEGKSGAADADILNAMDWMATQGVDIINFSGGGHGNSHNGTSAQDKKVEEMSAKGILWVNSAGNDGNKHWAGKIADNNRNRVIDLGYGDLLRFQTSGEPFAIIFNWDDWGDTSQSDDIDIDLFVIDPSGKVRLENTQTRHPDTNPIDVIEGQLPAGEYAIVATSNKLSNKKLHIYIRGRVSLLDGLPSGSIGIPGTSKGALTVGAWDVRKERIADYSSQGRTDDNRTKPEISAPAGAVSMSYQVVPNGDGRFHGTSASSPYAAGFAALVWANNRNWTAKQVKDFMINKATRSISRNSPSIASGYGLLDARKALSASAGHSPRKDDYRRTPQPPVHKPQPSNDDNEAQDLLDMILAD